MRWLWLSVFVIGIDQATKLWVEHAFNYREVLPVLPMFNLTLAYNQGAAFSFLSDAGGWQRWFFTALAIGVSAVIVVWMKRLPRDDHWQLAGLSLILGGAIGNVIDRIAYGHVIDFLDVYWNNSHWPAFNVADSSITVGAAILIVLSLFGDKEATDESATKT